MKTTAALTLLAVAFTACSANNNGTDASLPSTAVSSTTAEYVTTTVPEVSGTSPEGSGEPVSPNTFNPEGVELEEIGVQPSDTYSVDDGVNIPEVTAVVVKESKNLKVWCASIADVGKLNRDFLEQTTVDELQNIDERFREGFSSFTTDVPSDLVDEISDWAESFERSMTVLRAYEYEPFFASTDWLTFQQKSSKTAVLINSTVESKCGRPFVNEQIIVDVTTPET
jgi:hypothetical protein